MKGIRTIVWMVMAVGLFALVGCGKAGNTPEGTVQAYIDAAKAGNMDGVMDTLTPESREFVQATIDIMGQAEIEKQMTADMAEDVEVTVGESTITEDTATVVVVRTQGGQSSQESLPLLKVDGAWKINLVGDMSEQERQQTIEMMKSMKQMGDAMQQQLNQEMPEMSEEMRKSLEEANRQLESMGKE